MALPWVFDGSGMRCWSDVGCIISFCGFGCNQVRSEPDGLMCC